MNDTNRASGRTTRLADVYIQDLFTNGYIKVTDHHDSFASSEALFLRIISRLKNEHPHLKLRIGRRGLSICLDKTKRAIILTRKDLSNLFSDLPIDEVSINCFKSSAMSGDEKLREKLVVFKDGDQFKVLKNALNI